MFTEANVTIFVADLEKALAYYQDRLGLQVLVHAPKSFVLLQVCPAMSLGLHPASSQSPPGTMMLGLKPTVPIGDAVRELRAHGIDFADGIRRDGPISFAGFRDPDGAKLYLCEESKAP